MKKLNREDIEAIGRRVYVAYLKLPEVKSQRQIYNVNPDLLIKKLLGFQIEYRHLSLDGLTLGLTCTDSIGIEVFGDDRSREMILLDGKTILIEKDLQSDQKRHGQLNYTKCHEASHLIYKMEFPADYGSKPGELPKPLFSKEAENNRGCIKDWEEWQADVLASTILLPEDLIRQGMFRLGLGEPITLLNRIYAPAIHEKFCILAAMLGSSKSALAYRMQRLGLLINNQLADPHELIDVNKEL